MIGEVGSLSAIGLWGSAATASGRAGHANAAAAHSVDESEAQSQFHLNFCYGCMNFWLHELHMIASKCT